jgi:NAD(P)H-dependent flavin oxidoreductase YrpB (nitropropane dioxygenase family)
MHYVGFAELAAAVSNAGGLGIITALSQKSPDALRVEIRKARQLTVRVIKCFATLRRRP